MNMIVIVFAFALQQYYFADQNMGAGCSFDFSTSTCWHRIQKSQDVTTTSTGYNMH